MSDKSCVASTAEDHVAASVLREVGRLAHMTDCAVGARLPAPVTVAQYAVLETLSRQDGLSITQLADIHTVSQPTMSSTVAKLRERGLVETRTKPGDRRARFVTLTPEGQDMKAECDDAARPVRSNLGTHLSGADWIALEQLVARLNGHLSETLRSLES